MSSNKLSLRQLSVEDLTFFPDNPRVDFYDESLRDLSQSLQQDGLIEPIVVRPKGDRFEVVAGERRVRAAIIGNIPKLWGIVREDLGDEDASRLRLIENMKRKDLTIVEKVVGIKAHIKKYQISLEKIAEELGVKAVTIQSWFHTVDKLSPKIKEDLSFVRKLSPDILALLGKYEFKIQEKLARIIVKHKLTDWTARQFADMFETRPDADLDEMAERAKKQVKTIAVTLPVKEAQRVQRRARAFRENVQKRSKNIGNILRKRVSKKAKEEEPLSEVRLPIEHPSLRRERDIEVTRVSDQLRLSDAQTGSLINLTRQFPGEKVKDLAVRVQSESAPQIMVVEVEPKIYSALESFAEAEKLFVKQAALKLVEEGLIDRGFLKKRG